MSFKIETQRKILEGIAEKFEEQTNVLQEIMKKQNTMEKIMLSLMKEIITKDQGSSQLHSHLGGGRVDDDGIKKRKSCFESEPEVLNHLATLSNVTHERGNPIPTKLKIKLKTHIT